MKVLFLNITEIKNQATKCKLAKEYYKKINKLVESGKTWRKGKKESEIHRLHNEKKSR